MEALFNKIELQLSGRSEHIVRLKQTLEAFKQKPELFDEKDVSIITGVLTCRMEEYTSLNQNFTAMQELYRATVMDLECKIKEKEDMLRKADATFGSISAEDELRLHFAHKQALLHKNLQKAKEALCASIFEQLQPSASGGGKQ